MNEKQEKRARDKTIYASYCHKCDSITPTGKYYRINHVEYVCGLCLKELDSVMSKNYQIPFGKYISSNFQTMWKINLIKKGVDYATSKEKTTARIR